MCVCTHTHTWLNNNVCMYVCIYIYSGRIYKTWEENRQWKKWYEHFRKYQRTDYGRGQILINSFIRLSHKQTYNKETRPRASWQVGREVARIFLQIELSISMVTLSLVNLRSRGHLSSYWAWRDQRAVSPAAPVGLDKLQRPAQGLSWHLGFSLMG